MDYLIPYIPSDPSPVSSPPVRLQTPFSALAKVRDNIHGCIQANAPRRPVEREGTERVQRGRARERVETGLKVTGMYYRYMYLFNID